MWLYNALKLKKTYSFTVFSTFWWLFKVSCGFQSYPHVGTRCEEGIVRDRRLAQEVFLPNREKIVTNAFCSYLCFTCCCQCSR